MLAFGRPLHEVEESEWDTVVDTNLKGVWHTTKATVPYLIRQGRGGSVVMTGSTSSVKGTPLVGPYTAAKHGLLGLARTQALELAEHRIRVNVVIPTGVATPMVQNDALYQLFLPEQSCPKPSEAAKLIAATNAINVPWVEPGDVSDAVAFLASDEARYVTGTELRVDAGFLLR